MKLTKEEIKQYTERLETYEFFTKFVSENPDLICSISINTVNWLGKAPEGSSRYSVHVYYLPKNPKPYNPNWDKQEPKDYSWMSGYGEHGVFACETLGIDYYSKYKSYYIEGYGDKEYDKNVDKKWDDVFLEWRSELRDNKLKKIIDEFDET